LIKKIIGLAKNLTPIALIGAGGIGKTSIALTVLHNDSIKQQFGDNRWFIRCDQFPASNTHFLHRLSTVIGAGVENPEDLAPLRPFLSSKEMLIILDNAESILDPQETNAQEIYNTVEELSQLNNICLCITSRISTIPPDCETLVIPTLSMEAAHDAFYRIYKNGKQSNLTNDILKQLDFHPLSITLLATVAHHNMWDPDQLAREWEQHHTGVLQTEHNKSLAATIELSLSSPMFQRLGSDARDLLGVVAFFPQGVDRNNLDWLFPTIPNRTKIFDKFCILSLTYQSNGFITMLAPLRDYLCPKDPTSSPLLCTTRDCYFHRLVVDLYLGKSGFEKSQWIASEDVNVEHLLDIFTTVDPTLNNIWDVCDHFMEHLLYHKPRLVILGQKIAGLPDNHPSKPVCLFHLSQLFGRVGNLLESKQLLTCTLKLFREQEGEHLWVGSTLSALCSVNRLLGLYKEGLLHAEGALEIYKRLNYAVGQAGALQQIVWLLHKDEQLAAAEEAASYALSFSIDTGDQVMISQGYNTLGHIYYFKGETEKSICHFETALGIVSSLNLNHNQTWIHLALGSLFCDQGRFDDARVHIEHCKSYAINDLYLLGHTMVLQARLLSQQHRYEEAKAEALQAAKIYEKLGAVEGLEWYRVFIQQIGG